MVKQHAGNEITVIVTGLFLSKGKTCDGDDEDYKAELVWQVVDDGGRDDCSFPVKKTEPGQLN